MGRHTGDYLLGAIFLSAWFLIAMSHGTTGSANHVAPNGFQSNFATPWNEFGNQRGLSRNRSSGPSHRQIAVIRNISRGSRIVIGSLDVSGARHTVSFKVATPDSDQENQPTNLLPVHRYSASEVRQRTPRRYPWESQDLSCITINDRDRDAIGDECQVQKCSLDTTSRSRIFLTPHFGVVGTVNEPVECQILDESRQVRVYADHRMVSALRARFFSPAKLQRLLAAVETRALPIVEEWIGEVADVDGDEKLSIVVTDLDRNPQSAAERAPIHGCIRETDFQGNSDFRGDIIYIDPGILELPTEELAGLLTHELTHAAICSMFCVRSLDSEVVDEERGIVPAMPPVPPWLNEAVAHFAELKSCEESRNFRHRIEQFLADSSQCPIVASESVLSLQERRAGSRCASTWFLSEYLTSPQAVQKFLHSGESALDRRIAEVAGQSFDIEFRRWALSIASTDRGCLIPNSRQLKASDKAVTFTLLGTAFTSLETPADVTTLIIEADSTAQLQVSVLEPATNAP